MGVVNIRSVHRSVTLPPNKACGRGSPIWVNRGMGARSGRLCGDLLHEPQEVIWETTLMERWRYQNVFVSIMYLQQAHDAHASPTTRILMALVF